MLPWRNLGAVPRITRRPEAGPPNSGVCAGRPSYESAATEP